MASRVAVTTTADRYHRIAANLESLGLEPVMLPCIEVAAAPHEVLREAREEAARADWLLMTSARTVSVLWPDGGMPEVPIAAVGPRTAAAVVNAGGQLELVGEGGGEAIASRLDGLVRGRSVFFPHASGADPATASALGKGGATVHSVVVYETRSIPPKDDPVDAAMFGSPSAVRGWLQSRSLEGLVIGAIGTTTSSALKEHGHPPDVMPRQPSFSRLSQLMAEKLGERSSV